jgi:hypothetical protein
MLRAAIVGQAGGTRISSAVQGKTDDIRFTIAFTGKAVEFCREHDIALLETRGRAALARLGMGSLMNPSEQSRTEPCSVPGAGADQLTLEFGQTAENSQHQAIGFLPARICCECAVASPEATSSTLNAIEKPCATMVASVAPCGEPASSVSARRRWRSSLSCDRGETVVRSMDMVAGKAAGPRRHQLRPN